MPQNLNTNPQNGQLKTVSQFFASGQPLTPIDETPQPYPSHMVGGVPFPSMPGAQQRVWSKASAPIMTLRTLFAKPYGSTSR